ncbi:MAG TPA: Crp/Fnr family transcriptional regulator [Candidatus Saccharimonadales bacterium]|nr:Crp/Fnr family transcriptional regulator [Candidatus Saccharimonadales bacterium]
MLTATSPPNDNDFVNLFHQGKKLAFNKGEFIVKPGTSPSGVFYIASGLVKAYDITKYGDENLLIIRKSGEIIGLTRAITGRDRRIMYTALTTVIAFYIDHETFQNYLVSHPKAALPLVDMLVDMYRLHSERILNLEYRTVRERLASFLLGLVERFGQNTPDGILLDVPLRHQDIASSISATRETTSRELTVLERQGLLTRKQFHITITNEQKLRQYLE